MFRSPLGVTAWLRAPPLEGFEPAHTTPEALSVQSERAGHWLGIGTCVGTSPQVVHEVASRAD